MFCSMHFISSFHILFSHVHAEKITPLFIRIPLSSVSGIPLQSQHNGSSILYLLTLPARFKQGTGEHTEGERKTDRWGGWEFQGNEQLFGSGNGSAGNENEEKRRDWKVGNKDGEALVFRIRKERDRQIPGMSEQRSGKRPQNEKGDFVGLGSGIFGTCDTYSLFHLFKVIYI